MELTKWVEASDNDILSDIYQQTINYVVSGQHPTVNRGAVSATLGLRFSRVSFNLSLKLATGLRS